MSSRLVTTRDRLQQGGAQGVGFGQVNGDVGVGLQPSRVQRHCQVGQEGPQHALVVGGQVGAPEHEHGAAVLDEIPALPFERLGWRVRAGRGIHDPAVVAVRQQGHSLQPEGRTQLVEELRQWIPFADEETAGVSEGRRFGARLERLPAA
jgi:hypothetical protein